jgi:hypothetical protein
VHPETQTTSNLASAIVEAEKCQSRNRRTRDKSGRQVQSVERAYRFVGEWLPRSIDDLGKMPVGGGMVSRCAR